MKILCWKLTDVEFDFSYREYECGQKKSLTVEWLHEVDPSLDTGI